MCPPYINPRDPAEKPTNTKKINSIKSLGAEFINKPIRVMTYDLLFIFKSEFGSFCIWQSVSSLAHFFSDILSLCLLQPPAITGKPLVAVKVVKHAIAIYGTSLFI